ncbi:hypothetical protein PHLH3_47980 [Pseudomonas sp. St386]|nr:hypothetical protein PHLH3_47980 [Pseudomonas sp. St386]
MTGLILENVEKHYGSACAVTDVNLHLPEGKLVCFLGPSGCGKTTLLRMIAGLESLSGGEIRLDGQDIGHTPAHLRNFGMVFQSLALFPHMTVGENIAYPLKLRGVGKVEQQARVVELLELIQLQAMIDRPVAKLSGGQRQRVAIARAIAARPKILLLDEPLSALDAKLRESMQVEIRQLQQRLNITTILVTHDQREAMTMADIVVVLGSIGCNRSVRRSRSTGTPPMSSSPTSSAQATFFRRPPWATDGSGCRAGTRWTCRPAIASSLARRSSCWCAPKTCNCPRPRPRRVTGCWAR